MGQFVTAKHPSPLEIGIRLLALALATCGMRQVDAHPLIENALDVIVTPDRIIVDARIAREEVTLIEGESSRLPNDLPADLLRTHGDYVLRHVSITVDGQATSGHVVAVPPSNHHPTEDVDAAESAASPSTLLPYRLEFALSQPPRQVGIRQDFLKEHEGWTCACVLRTRRIDEDEFDPALLKQGKLAVLDCEWPEQIVAKSAGEAHTGTDTAALFWAFLQDGVEHILTGYDHLLFVTALVLAANRLWDLFKVVSAFTLAHTLTLALSALKLVTLSERIVEPMIAASIVFVAVQNIYWPERNTGPLRLAVAFGFGLFHGLGFASGLQAAMSEMPGLAFWTALIAFSLGVEIGHQIVVLPLFGLLKGAKAISREQVRSRLSTAILKYGSAAVALGGVYFLYNALA